MTLKACLFAAALALAAPAALAADFKVGAIEIKSPWARATPPGAEVGAGYFTLTNTGSTPDRLVGVTCEAAGQVEIHEMAMVNGVMRMRPLKNGIELKPGETVELKSGAYHMMMLDLKRPLKAGEMVKGTLTFEKAGKVDIEYVVGSIGSAAPPAAAAPASPPAGGMKMEDMNHGGMKVEDMKH